MDLMHRTCTRRLFRNIHPKKCIPRTPMCILPIYVVVSSLIAVGLIITTLDYNARGGPIVNYNPDLVVLHQQTLHAHVPYKSTPNEADMNEVALQMATRRRRLEKACSAMTNSKSKKNLSFETQKRTVVLKRMLIDRKHSLSWCPIYKAGSSSWIRYFAELSGTFGPAEKYLVEKKVLDLSVFRNNAKAIPTDKYLDILHVVRNTTKLIIVRHPFERLLSAYRDKLERTEDRQHYHMRYGQHIVNQYRDLDYISDLKGPPSFTEFLLFLVTERNFNEHWRPYNNECDPCFIRYDYILKLETYKRDEAFVIRQLGLDEINKVELILGNTNSLNNYNPKGKTDLGVAKRYYSKVPKWLLERAYGIYKKDFDMFVYSPDMYYDMALQESTSAST